MDDKGKGGGFDPQTLAACGFADAAVLIGNVSVVGVILPSNVLVREAASVEEDLLSLVFLQ
jgi:hypothetical protein